MDKEPSRDIREDREALDDIRAIATLEALFDGVELAQQMGMAKEDYMKCVNMVWDMRSGERDRKH